MRDHLTDGAAIVTTVTAPAWATYLATINIVLTCVSLVAGLAFLVWQWRRAARREPPR